MSKKTLTILVSLMSFAMSYAQEITPVVVASGGQSAGRQMYYLAYTIGETTIVTLEKDTLTLTQGFHQGEIIKPQLPSDSTLFASPNPVTKNSNHKLFISFYGDETQSFTITIHSLQGRNVKNDLFENMQKGDYREVDFIDYPAGLYLLKAVSKDGKIHRIFKIEKL